MAAEPQGSAASGLSCKCKELDRALHCALSPIHDFSQVCVKFGARIDFFRGTIADHLMNKGWSDLYEQLPSYRHPPFVASMERNKKVNDLLVHNFLHCRKHCGSKATNA